MSAEEREAFSNLLLLCTPHHHEVDDRISGAHQYPADLLRQWKLDREGEDASALAALGAIDDRALETLLVDSFRLPLERLENISKTLVQSTALAARTIAELQTFLADGRAGRVPRARRPWMAPPLDRMIDRGPLCAEILGALRPDEGDPQLTISLHGAGGFGKTTLAKWLCHQPEIQERFTGGLLWVTAGKETPAATLAERINDLSYQLSGDRPPLADPDAAGAELGQRLDAATSPVLLIVDDVWDRVQLNYFRHGGQRCTRLVTTRMPDLLAGMGKHIAVDEMTAEQATELVGLGIAGLGADLTARLVSLAGRWPVLLNLISGALATRVGRRQSPEEAARQIVEKLVASGPAAFDSSNPAERAQAVASTIAASLDLLDETDRDRYLDLGIFAEGTEIPLDILALLWPERDADALCDQLSRLGLTANYRLDPPSARIQLHDVIRAHLFAQRTESEHRAVHARLVDAARALCDEGCHPAGSTQWWTLPHHQRYLWDHLVTHLMCAGMSEEAVALVHDLRWAEASVRACESTVSVEADLAQAGGPLAADLVRMLRRISHLLGPIEPWSALGVTLASRLAHDPTLQPLIENFRPYLTRPYLQPRWPLPDVQQQELVQTLEGHIGPVNDCAFGPGGSVIASGGVDGTVRVWDLATGLPRRNIVGHASSVNRCGFSPSGTLIVSASDDGTARVWDVATGVLVRSYEHPRKVMDVTVSPDGRLLATAGTDCIARIWNLDSGKLVSVLKGHTRSVNGCAFSPDGRLLATVSSDKTARLWTVGTGSEYTTLTGHVSSIWDCSFSPDGKVLATVGTDRAARLWDTATGKHVGNLWGHHTAVHGCEFSRIGSLLATASNDRTARLWDTATRKPHRALIGHTEWVNACALSPDETLLASASSDATVRVWDLGSGTAGPERSALSAPAADVAFSPDGRLLASATSGTAGEERLGHIWDVATGDLRTVLGAHGIPIQSCAFAVDGSMVATTGYGDVKVWNTGTGQLTVEFHTRGIVSACAFSLDGTHLASTTEEGRIEIWHLGTGARKAILSDCGKAVRTFAYSPDGTFCAAGGDDRSIAIWDTITLTEQERLTGHGGTIYCCAFSPNGDYLASASADQTVLIWERSTGSVALRLNGHAAPVRGCAFSPDGSMLATAGEDRTVRIWDIRNAKCLAALRIAEAAHNCTWHPHKPLIAVAGRAGTYLLEYLGTPVYMQHA